MGNKIFSDGIVDSWIEEAMEEVNKSTWREANINALLLLIHGFQRKRDETIVRILMGPVKLFCGVLLGGLIWWIIRDILHIP